MKAKVVFMGTPDFAVASLKAIVNAGHDVVGVVTVPDKPAGRGHQLRPSPVKQFAVESGLKVLQPEKLKDPEFLSELGALEADLFVVVAFRMLPKEVWSMPVKGTFNLHGSLLPDYRGAAPINWAVINGEKKTGVTTFLIDDQIDTGDILLCEELQVYINDTVGDVHDELMEIGASLVTETISGLLAGTLEPKNQQDILKGRAPKMAPKIFKETCKIDWAQGASAVHNLIRGMSPYPAAFFEAEELGKKVNIKVFKSESISERLPIGAIDSDGKSFLKIGTGDGAIDILRLQYPGKKQLDIQQFLTGKKPENFKILVDV